MKFTSLKTKIIAACLAVLFCIPCFAFSTGAASNIVLSVNSPDVIAGDEFTVAVSLSGNEGVAGISVSLDFDRKVLIPVDVSAGSALGSKSVVSNVDEPYIDASLLNCVTAVYVGATDIKRNGEFFVFTFKVRDGVKNVISGFSVSCDSASNQKGEVIGTNAVSGKVTVFDKNNITLKPNAKNIKYMAGYADGTFKPKQSATRYEVVECFYNLFDVKGKLKESIAFTDVDSKYKEMVDLFTSSGAINGYPDNTFGGDKPILRSEFCKVIVYLLGLQNEEAVDQGFPDVDMWAKDYINICAAKGLVKGRDDGRFDPKAEISRAEVATLLNRITGAEKGTSCIYPDVSGWFFGDVAAAAK